MKRYFLYFLFIFLFPLIVFARDKQDLYSIGTVYLEGDVISVPYNDFAHSYEIYLDSELLTSFTISPEEQVHEFTIPNRAIITNYIKGNNEDPYNPTEPDKYYFESYDSDRKIYCYAEDFEEKEDSRIPYDNSICDDYLEVGRIYNVGDIVYAPDDWRYFNFYGLNGESVEVGNKLFVFPNISGNDVYWRFTKLTPNEYNLNCPYFEAISYVEPKFELECNPKKIYYGEKALCSLYVSSNNKLKELSFDFDVESFGILGVTLEEGVEESNGDRRYNYVIQDGYNQLPEKSVLLTFYLSGLKNEFYEDDLKISNIRYVDGDVLGEFKTLDSSLEILAHNEEKNPDTSDTYLPIVVVLVSLTAFVFAFTEMKNKGIMI